MASTIQNVDPSCFRKLARLPKAFSYQALKKATNDFSEKLGEGASASVFKGRLEDGTPIAVKRIKASDNCKMFFEGEVSTIGNLHHKNLVHMQGFCSHEIETGGDSYIVYDLLQNGSLNSWILPRDGIPGDQILSWKLRYQVAIDVAKALIYLHNDCRPPIIHFDVKPANVLLDENFGGVLADFGLSVLTKKDGRHVNSFIVRGTPGYIAPEVVTDNEKSSKSDMYSFGKILLDMFFGQVYVCLDKDGNEIYNKDGNSLAEVRTFHSFIREKLENNEIVHLADKRLENVLIETGANTLVDVALRCVEYDPSRRPGNMQRVLQVLEQGQQDQHEYGGTTDDTQQAEGRQAKKCKTHFETGSGSGQAPLKNPLPVTCYGPPELIPGKRSEAFASQQSIKHQILTALKNNQVSMVGVYGMGGVGKTTLMKQILRDTTMSSLFEIVLMVTISQNRPLEEIQTEIAEKLGGEKIVETSVSVRAMRLSARLKQAKSLVILDDIWKELSLEEVGIPHGEDHHGCKVVMTTRSSDVCTGMEAQVSIEMQVLTADESWELFHQNSSNDVDSNEVQSLAKTMVKECKELPLAIVVLAKALKGKKRDLWDTALQQLKRSISKHIWPALSSIRMSFEYLDCNETKFCFLLCCLFPEDYKISMDELLMYAVGEDILADADTLAEARGQLLQIVENLISSNLLLKCDDSKFMMHDIVRDAAISIASENGNNFIVKAGMGLSECPKLKETVLRLSLMHNNITAFPSQLGCQQLVTLSLAGNNDLRRVPDEFFTGMTSLTTLDLSTNKIYSLPQSLSNLTKLRVLNLGYCENLDDLSLCGFLMDLEILNLEYCNDIWTLPEEFILLTNLRLLNLCGNSNFAIIPPNVISSLSRLEELYLPMTFSNWENEGMDVWEGACLSELSSLTKLSTLFVNTKDISLLFKDLPFCWKNLMKFRIAVTDVKLGGCDKHSEFGDVESEVHFSNCLKISSVDDIKTVAEWVRGLWGKPDLGLAVENFSNITNVIPLLCSSFYNLKYLRLELCEKIEYVVQLEEIGDEVIFTGLEELKLRLRNMKGICSSGPVPKGSLNKLKYLYIYECHELVNVIPSGLLVQLHNLELVDVEDCSNVEVLFNLEGFWQEGHASMLSKLEIIKLFYLRRLRMIWKGFSYNVIPQNLTTIYLSGCHKLKYALPLSMANLQQLQSLEISYCDEMVQIFGSEEEKEEDEIHEISSCSQHPEIKAVFSRLKSLLLQGMQSLSNFHSHSSIIFSFPSLESVSIQSCLNLRRVPLNPDGAPKLKNIRSDKKWSWGEFLSSKR